MYIRKIIKASRFSGRGLTTNIFEKIAPSLLKLSGLSFMVTEKLYKYIPDYSRKVRKEKQHG